MKLWSLGLSGFVGYLLGTIPSADVVSKIVGGPDLRHAGSKNPGAANAASVLGPGAGLVVLGVDIAKGAVAARFGRRVGVGGRPDVLAQVGSTAAVLGHCYPVWTGFRGGKGVATGVGQVLATFPAFFPIDLVVAVLTVASPRWKQRAFVTTGTASVAWVCSGLVWWRKGYGNLWGATPSGALPCGALASSLVILRRFWESR